MPSKSGKQHRLMALVANDPKAAKRLGISQKVGKEFMKADKGKKFSGGGASKSDDSDLLTPEEARLQAEYGDTEYMKSLVEGRKQRKKQIEGLGRRFTGTYGETREALSSLSPSQKRKALAASAAPALALVPGKALLGAGAIGMAGALGKTFNDLRQDAPNRERRERERAEKAKKETEEKSKSSYRKGGSVKSSASSRADGIAQRGKTRGKFI